MGGMNDKELIERLRLGKKGARAEAADRLVVLTQERDEARRVIADAREAFRSAPSSRAAFEVAHAILSRVSQGTGTDARAAAWWRGVEDQWKHRPMGNRLLPSDNPFSQGTDKPPSGYNGYTLTDDEEGNPVYRLGEVPSAVVPGAHLIAAAIRAHCTPSSEAYDKGGDALIYAVADWIEDPPEWVDAPWRAPQYDAEEDNDHE